MSDGITLNATTVAGGPTVRTIDRGASGETQVIGLDFGGEAGPEQLVSKGNPLPVSLPNGATDAFGQMVAGARHNDIALLFSGPGVVASNLAVTATGGAGYVENPGQVRFSTGLTNPSTLFARTNQVCWYDPGSEVFGYWTAYFLDSMAGTFQRIGLTDSQNGFFVGFEGTVFSVGIVNGGSVSTVGQSSFNLDTLTGSTGSLFTRAGVAEALDPTKQNVFRVRFGWLGSAPIVWEVLSPDGVWIAFHQVRQPNTANVPSIQNPNLPIGVWLSDNGSGLTVGSSCWAAGSSSFFSAITEPLSAMDRVIQTRGVAMGQTAAGAYVNQQLDAAGAIVLSAGNNINVAQLAQAQSSDAPIFAAITGDPAGDFAGVNILEQIATDGTGIAFNTRILNLPKQDAQGAAIPSDCVPVQIGPLAVGQSAIIDTIGYAQMQITCQGSFAANLFVSMDQISWSSLYAYDPMTWNSVILIGSAHTFAIPLPGRYVKLTATTQGNAVAMLRSAPFSAVANVVSLNTVAGSNVASAGVPGVISIGGNVAPGLARTANPVPIGAVDSSNLTRALIVTASSALGAPALVVDNAAQNDGLRVPELLALVLFELRIANQQRHDMLIGTTNPDAPDAYRADPALFN